MPRTQELFSLEGHDVPALVVRDDISRLSAELEAAEIARDEACADIDRLELALRKARAFAHNQHLDDLPHIKAEIEELTRFVRMDQKRCEKHPNHNTTGHPGPASLVQFDSGTVTDLEGVDLSHCGHSRRAALVAKREVHQQREAFRWGLCGLAKHGGMPLDDTDLDCAIRAARAGMGVPLKQRLQMAATPKTEEA